MERKADSSIKALFRLLCRVKNDKLHVKKVGPNQYEANTQPVDVELHSQFPGVNSIVIKMPLYSETLGQKVITEESVREEESNALTIAQDFVDYFLARGREIVWEESSCS